ncbi:MAG: SRPBCC family protein [Bacteroidia bacterium]|jgi:carbon monoxide dehydrogenase subunit G|nr:SRPBCC family protein [Bacteroidia bacterium]MCC6767535.1 SRPBCC family protein [Bacteroidia bacterium]
MLTIEPAQEVIPASQKEVYAFLSDMNNLQQLMPEQVVNWKSDADACSYTIKGMADISMRVVQREPESKIFIKSDGKGPFPFSLTFDVIPEGGSSKASLKFEGDVPMMLSFMVEKPLKNFFGLLVSNLAKKFS